MWFSLSNLRATAGTVPWLRAKDKGRNTGCGEMIQNGDWILMNSEGVFVVKHPSIYFPSKRRIDAEVPGEGPEVQRLGFTLPCRSSKMRPTASWAARPRWQILEWQR